MASAINISDELYHRIKETTNGYYALQIILFFADHPYARFSEMAIFQAVKRPYSNTWPSQRSP